MNIELRSILPPLVAVLILIVLGVQTSNALKEMGSRQPHATPASKRDPYFGLDHQIARSMQARPAPDLRDPFIAAATPRPVATRPTTGTRRPQQVAVVPPPPPRPVVTAIVDDADPRALIRYEDRNYSVKKGDLFAEFRVVSITGDQVVLDGPGGSLVLRRPIKGD